MNSSHRRHATPRQSAPTVRQRRNEPPHIGEVKVELVALRHLGEQCLSGKSSAEFPRRVFRGKGSMEGVSGVQWWSKVLGRDPFRGINEEPSKNRDKRSFRILSAAPALAQQSDQVWLSECFICLTTEGKDLGDIR